MHLIFLQPVNHKIKILHLLALKVWQQHNLMFHTQSFKLLTNCIIDLNFDAERKDKDLR